MTRRLIVKEYNTPIVIDSIKTLADPVQYRLHTRFRTQRAQSLRNGEVPRELIKCHAKQHFVLNNEYRVTVSAVAIFDPRLDDLA